MPRPERIRLKEQALADGVDTDAAPPEPVKPPTNRKEEVALRRQAKVVAAAPEPEPLDEQQEVVQPVKTGKVVEDDAELELSSRVAKRMGWMSKEEWVAAGRNPDRHVDPMKYLEDTPKHLENARERMKRLGQVAEEQIAIERREALAQARKEHEAAVRAGDVEAADKAVDKIAKTSGPPPQTVAWMARNSWFNTDPDAQAIAVNAIRRAEQNGATIEDALQAGEAAARRRFPEHFDDVQPVNRQPEARPEPRREARLSDVRPAPPVLAEGSRGSGANTRPKEKGWADIPSAGRSQMEQFVKRGMRRGLTETQARNELAARYWSTQA